MEAYLERRAMIYYMIAWGFAIKAGCRVAEGQKGVEGAVYMPPQLGRCATGTCRKLDSFAAWGGRES